MKIEFTQYRKLDDLSKTVAPGVTMESPADAPEELLRAYITNGIAKEVGVSQSLPDTLAPAPKEDI